jgi:hypothetical protein
MSGFGVLGVTGFSVLGGSSACLIYINPIQSSHSQTDKQKKNRKRERNFLQKMTSRSPDD